MSTPEAARVRYTYRLRVSRTATRRLLAEWDACRWVWNMCVEASKVAYTAGEECGPARLDKLLTVWRSEHDWLRGCASVPQQQTIRDFAKSRAKALMDIKNRVSVRQRAGLPKFRRKHFARPTLNFTKRGFRITDACLVLAGGIHARPVWSRDLPSEPTSVRIYRDAVGHWYASFVVETEAEPLPVTGRVIGIDWGVAAIATTTSDAHDLPHPEHGKRHAARLARYQRMMARRKPGKGEPCTKGYREAKRQAAKVHKKKVARQRRDKARKWAKTVARDHDAIAVEDFRPKFLAKSNMARKAADAAVSATKAALVHMAKKHARILHLVNPMNTTTDCGTCGARTTRRLPLSQRIYKCHSCGHSSPRDKNSANVMLNRAGLNPTGVDRVRPGQPLVDRAA